MPSFIGSDCQELNQMRDAFGFRGKSLVRETKLSSICCDAAPGETFQDSANQEITNFYIPGIAGPPANSYKGSVSFRQYCRTWNKPNHLSPFCGSAAIEGLIEMRCPASKRFVSWRFETGEPMKNDRSNATVLQHGQHLILCSTGMNIVTNFAAFFRCWITVAKDFSLNRLGNLVRRQGNPNRLTHELRSTKALGKEFKLTPVILSCQRMKTQRRANIP